VIDLDRTDRCPRGPRCEACGVETDDVAVETVDVRLGVACMSLCERCAASDVVPPITVSTAARFVMQHCQHLNITADEMAAAMEER
jgi:hypothetical protein